MRLRPGLDLLWRAPGEVQIGTDSRWAVRLSGLTDAEVDVLTEAEPGATLESLRSSAARHGLEAARIDALLRALDEARVVCPIPPRPPTAGSATLLSGAVGDARAWSAVLEDGDGGAHLRARSARSVGIAGLGRLGLQIAVVLAAAGVGTVLLQDDDLVTSADLGVGGYLPRDVGSSRTEAAHRIVHDASAVVRTRAPARTEPDLLVLVEHGAADPARSRLSMATGIPHLSVVVREASVLVGPLVVPGVTPCLRCVDLWRADADERWGVVVAQLAARARPRGPEESSLAAVAGSLAAAQALAHLDGRVPTVRGAGLEVSLPEAVPRVRSWTMHPDCGCGAIPPSGRGEAPPEIAPPGTTRPWITPPETASCGGVHGRA